MTEPLVSPDIDLRSFPAMPLDVEALRDSDFAALASAEAFRAAILLWCAAWHQVPAASLPADDRMLARLAGFGRDVDDWLVVKDDALRGFIPCDDGRLYHPVIADKAIAAWGKKRTQKTKTSAATAARLAKLTSRQRHVARDVECNEDRDVDRDEDRDGQRHESRDDHRHEECDGQRDEHQQNRIEQNRIDSSPKPPPASAATPSGMALDPRGEDEGREDEGDWLSRLPPIERVCLAVWRLEGVDDDRAKRWLVSLKGPGRRQAASWVDSAPVEEVLGKITAIADDYEGRGESVRDWWALLSKAIPAWIQHRDREAQSDAGLTVHPRAEESRWRGRARGWIASGFWMSAWGARPGEAGCQCPGHILAEFGIAMADPTEASQAVKP